MLFSITKEAVRGTHKKQFYKQQNIFEIRTLGTSFSKALFGEILVIITS